MRRKMLSSYRQRHRELLKLGFATYYKYNASQFWKMLRRLVLERDGFKCLRCGADATCVHHMSYSRRVLMGLDSHLLVSLCRGCHQRAEFYRGHKVRLVVANSRLGRLPARGQIDRSPLPPCVPDKTEQCVAYTRSGQRCKCYGKFLIEGKNHCEQHYRMAMTAAQWRGDDVPPPPDDGNGVPF
jgi:hypothetical protein